MESVADNFETSRSVAVTQTDPSGPNVTAKVGNLAAANTADVMRYEAPAVETLGKKANGLLSGAELKTGCVPRNDFVDQVINRSLAAILFIFVLPLFLTATLLVYVCSGRPIFYSGARLGKGRTLFNILKFRTLETKSAAKLTNNQTLPRNNTTVTKVGRYLRVSRLDELPQLINIMRGEMAFFGPRPVRPEVEGIYEVTNASHLIRFRVRPGLVGLSQAIMSHETPKSVRARFNRMCCKTEIHYGYLFAFVALVGFHVIAKSVKVAFGAIVDCFNDLSDHSWLSGGFNRPRHCRVEVKVGNDVMWGAVAGVSDELLQFVSNQPIEPGSYEATVVLKRAGGRVRKANLVLDLLVSQPCGIGKNGFAHFCNYSTCSDASRHFSERYLLQSAVLPS